MRENDNINFPFVSLEVCQVKVFFKSCDRSIKIDERKGSLSCSNVRDDCGAR